MVVRLEEGLGFVLAVNIDELPGKIGKGGNGGKPPPDKDPVAARPARTVYRIPPAFGQLRMLSAVSALNSPGAGI